MVLCYMDDIIFTQPFQSEACKWKFKLIIQRRATHMVHVNYSVYSMISLSGLYLFLINSSANLFVPAFLHLLFFPRRIRATGTSASAGLEGFKAHAVFQEISKKLEEVILKRDQWQISLMMVCCLRLISVL